MGNSNGLFMAYSPKTKLYTTLSGGGARLEKGDMASIAESKREPLQRFLIFHDIPRQHT